MHLGVSNRVFFEGSKDPAPYYALADLVLVTSLYEGYGLVIVEALAVGKPVLSTDVGVARDAGAIIATLDSFAAALSQWFKDGSRVGVLKNVPERDFVSYVRAYCDDIAEAQRI
jgi:glycosyltransferase involved in cell wall biosynthesis